MKTCFNCGRENPHGVASVYAGGHGCYVDRPICADDEGCSVTYLREQAERLAHIKTLVA